jgi:putative oxidoreductase
MADMEYPEERFDRLLPAHDGHGDVQTTLNLLGRVVFGGYFIYNGINHFMNRRMLVDHARHKGVPMADIGVPLTGAVLVAGGVSLLLGKRPRLGSGLIMGFLATVSPTMHAFWADEDDQERLSDTINFAKNMGLMGGALLAASMPQPWPTSVDRLMERRAHG